MIPAQSLDCAFFWHLLDVYVNVTDEYDERSMAAHLPNQRSP